MYVQGTKSLFLTVSTVHTGGKELISLSSGGIVGTVVVMIAMDYSSQIKHMLTNHAYGSKVKGL